MFARRSFRFCVLLLLVLVSWSTTPAQIPPVDPTINRHVQEAIDRHHRLRDANITIATLDGVVTLSGTVSNYLDKHALERIAARIIGVRSVVNRIVVDSLPVDDRQLQASIRQRLSHISSAAGRNVDVTVHDGVVTLSGSVASYAGSRQAERIAREVRGVRKLNNQLRVFDSAPAVPDDQLRDAIASTLANDGYLAGYQLEISVAEGVVTLSGDLPSLFLKQRAVNQARSVAGVSDVDDQMITDSQVLLQPVVGMRSDAELIKLIDRELKADPRVSDQGIKTKSLHGEIVLSGWTDSIDAKRIAGRIARQLMGVAKVSNQLEVRAAQRSDQQIRVELMEYLASDEILGREQIRVTAEEGVVTLAGQVSAHPHRRRATALTGRITGVRRIDNQLAVSPTQPSSDDSIRKAIVKRLTSHPLTSALAKQLDVKVKDGVVTLQGSVDRYVLILEVLRIASRTAGVREVDNQLQVIRQ
jgi:osmotically-inducible protein OsmY